MPERYLLKIFFIDCVSRDVQYIMKILLRCYSKVCDQLKCGIEILNDGSIC